MARTVDVTRPQTGWRTWLRRVPSRVVLVIAFALAALAFLVVTVPFDTTSAGGTTLQCGPPLYELVVPADPAFDVPENAGCAAPARQRATIGAVLLGAALLAAVLTELRSRRSTAVAHGRWLEGRRRPRRRSGGARPRRQGSGDAAARAAKAEAAATVSGPGADGSS